MALIPTLPPSLPWPLAFTARPLRVLLDAATSRSRWLYCQRNGHLWAIASPTSDRCLWCGTVG